MSSGAGGGSLGIKGWALGTIVVSLLLAVVASLLLRAPGEQEAVGQETTTPATVPPSTAPPASVPPFFPELTDAFASATADPESEGIPGLGVTDVTGQLYRYPVEGRFACVGPVPGDGEATLSACYAPSEGGQPTHEVTVAFDDPRSVLWVQGTVRGASDEEASEFFAYVAALCLRDADDPFNPEAWMSANVVSGEAGQVFAQGAEFSVYGTQEERTLQVVATDAL